MDVHEFHRMLGEALGKLDQVKGVEEQADAAQRRLNAKQAELDALAAAHAKLKADSDAHLANNLGQMNRETIQHNNEIASLKKQKAQLEELHKTQQENAGNTLTALNAQIGIARKGLEAMQIQHEQMKNTILDMAQKL